MGADPANDMVKIAKHYAGAAPFAHIRNVKICDNGDFTETSHLTSDGSIDITGVVKELHKTIKDMYVLITVSYLGRTMPPGYGLYDRALGIMYLNGLWDAFSSHEKGVKR